MSRSTVLQETVELLSTRSLVLGMVGVDGSFDTVELYEIADVCGMTHQQVRLCLRRLVTEGLFQHIGRGQESTFMVTDTGRRSLALDVEGLLLAYRQDAGLAAWDGVWHLVGFVVPEEKRSARDGMRGALITLGGAALQNGLYISPNVWEAYVREAAQHFDISEAMTFIQAPNLEYAGVTDPRQIAAHLWSLDALAERYRTFIQSFAGVEQVGQDGSDDRIIFPLVLAMADAFEACMRFDPLLPPELLPSSWAGKQAREVLARLSRHALERSERLRHSALFRSFDRVFEAQDAM